MKTIQKRVARRRKFEKGFTLIEIIVVVAIIALLAAIIIPVVAGQISKAKDTSQRADLKEIANAYTRFFIDTQVWPDPTGAGTWNSQTGGAMIRATELQGGTSLWNQPTGLASWKGPYINTNERTFGAPGGVADRWGKSYMIAYFKPGEPGPSNSGGSIVIYSRGPDGVDQSKATVDTAGQCPTAGTNDDVCFVATQRVQ